MDECKLCHENKKIKERDLCRECSIYSDEQMTILLLLKEELSIEINNAELDLREAKKKYLRQFGWEHDCSFPDSCWRWVKVVRGETIAVSIECALSIERSILHYKN